MLFRRVVLLFVFVITLCVVSPVMASFDRSTYDEPRGGFSVSDRVQVLDTAVYSTGYMNADGSSWSAFSLQGESFGDWVLGEAQSEVVPDSARYFAVFSCSWVGSWDCSETWQVLDRGERDRSDFDPSTDSLEGDFEALQDLYASTNGDGWFDNQGWPGMTPQTMGDAIGIEVDDDGRVVRIDLQKVRMDGQETLGNDLSGQLPATLGNLKRLEYLNVKQNNLSGPIPPELGLLTNLHQLSLAGQRCDPHAIRGWFEGNHRGCPGGSGKQYEETNQFSGPLPVEFANLENLWLLEIRGQYLTGTLPPEWGNLRNLERLFLNGVKGPDDEKLHGRIPPEWAGMESMQYFHLGNYREQGMLTGDFPQEINEAWTNLWNILLAGNQFTGSVPEFPNSRRKRYAHFGNNQFTGDFPSRYFDGNNSGLNALKINRNNLDGALPTEISSPAFPSSRDTYNLGTIRMTGNDFSGPIPVWLQDIPVIQFNLNGIGFSGPFPKGAAESKKLRLFWISGNNLEGPLPDVNWQGDALYSILIGGNDFSGEIPASWESMVTNYLDEDGDYTGRLWRIRLDSNNLEGLVPAWFADITTLNRLRLQNNRFTFRDILPHYDEILATMEVAVLTGRNDEPGFTVAPQQPFGESRSMEVVSGGSFSIDFSEYVGYSGNEYVWLLDGEVVAETTEPVLVVSASSSDAGVYVLRVTNPALEELTLFSEEVTVSVT